MAPDPASIALAQESPKAGDAITPSSGRRRWDLAPWFGWSALALVALLGLASSGLDGFFGLAGLYVLGVAVVALVRGRVEWAGLRSRAMGGIALFASFGVISFGVAVAEPPAEDPLASPAAADAEATPAPEESPPPRRTPAATMPPTTPATTEKGPALAAVATLAVKGRAPKTGYSRDAFGQAWFDADRNGCDTRNDMLRRDLAARDMANSCKVLAGSLTPDPYTGQVVRFERGGASEVDIDHVVALSDAWQKGAGAWTAERRLAFANDPLNLLAVDAGANRSKGDGDTATWLPPNASFRCTYVARQVAVKAKYDVWVTSSERDAMVRVLSSCATTDAMDPGPAPTEAALPKSKPKPRPKPAPAPEPPAPEAPSSVYYENCTAARAAGAAPITAGQPGYSRKLDRDGDGIGCE